jgi:hypothetical protein
MPAGVCGIGIIGGISVRAFHIRFGEDCGKRQLHASSAQRRQAEASGRRISDFTAHVAPVHRQVRQIEMAIDPSHARMVPHGDPLGIRYACGVKVAAEPKPIILCPLQFERDALMKAPAACIAVSNHLLRPGRARHQCMG